MILRAGRALALGLMCATPGLAGMPAGHAATLKLATWNLDWLTARPTGDPALPGDVHGRSTADFDRLAAYAAHLDADAVGFEEVETPAIAARLFPPDRYTVLMTDDPVIQRVGIAVRKPLTVTANPELRALDVSGPGAQYHLRSGLDVTLSDGHAQVRVLVVHLKTGCWDYPLTASGHSCPVLRQQLAVLANWIAERQDEGEAFAVVGDFNRRMFTDDPFYRGLLADGPLTLATAGHASPCWGGEYFIDHIVLGNAARDWLVPGSLRVMTYHDAPPVRAALSDHCPVSVRLALPGPSP